MPIAFIIGAGSGVVSAALFASAATATAIAAILFYLTPLPLGLAGLGWGASAAAIAGLVGTLLIALVLGPGPAGAFAAAAGMPIARQPTAGSEDLLSSVGRLTIGCHGCPPALSNRQEFQAGSRLDLSRLNR